MKAKEYAQLLTIASDDPNPDCFKNVAIEVSKQFITETQALIKARNAISNQAVINILNEMDQKWRKFAAIVNKDLEIDIIKYDGYESMIGQAAPMAAVVWLDSKKQQHEK